MPLLHPGLLGKILTPNVLLEESRRAEFVELLNVLAGAPSLERFERGAVESLVSKFDMARCVDEVLAEGSEQAARALGAKSNKRS